MMTTLAIRQKNLTCTQMQAYVRNTRLALTGSIAILKCHLIAEQNPNAEWKFQVIQNFKRHFRLIEMHLVLKS